MALIEEWNDLLKSESDIYIYGAGKYGKTLFEQLKKDGKNENVKGFLVSDLTNNPKIIEDKPVLLINSFYDKTALILVAAPYRYQEEILMTLKSLEFKNIINAEKFLFIESKDVDVVETKKLLLEQYENAEFCRYDIVIYLLAIEGYYKKNSFGLSLYKKMQNDNTTLNNFEFLQLLEINEIIESDMNTEIIVDNYSKILDRAWQLALAIYNNVSYVRVRTIGGQGITKFNMDWLGECFCKSECTIITDKFNEILINSDGNEKSNKEKVIEEIYAILGKGQEFGNDEFYQSLEELDIKGMRPTEERINIYGLKDIVNGKRVFDIGCNCGFLDIRLGLMAKSVNGIEYNKGLVKIANIVKNYLGRENVYFEVGDFRKYIIKERYDVVFSFAVHHWIGLPPETYCNKVISMLEMGGYLTFESHGTRTEDVEFENYCNEFERRGLTKIKEGEICDDGKCFRRFIIYKRGI